MKQLKKWIPPKAKILWHKVKYYLCYTGKNRYCPICGRSSSQFLPMIFDEHRYDVKCPYCYSYERHRLLYLFLQRKSDLFTGPKNRKILHIAPEPCLVSVFRKVLGSSYQTADLGDPNADIKMDICNNQFPDETFDVILCSHVLEHVPDDQKAMRDFSRTLKSDGWAILLVPITADKTFEDPTVTDPAERVRLFGIDHLRRYGPDYADRLRKNNFQVSRIDAKDFLSEEEDALMAIKGGEIYFCTKSPGVPSK